LAESFFAMVPQSLHTQICRSRIGRSLLGITILVQKPS
jgi:hypothetical protein